MLLWRCYLTPHPTITVQFVLTLALASLLMLMGAGLGMAGELVPAYVGIIITALHHNTSLCPLTSTFLRLQQRTPIKYNSNTTALNLHTHVNN